MIIGFGSRADPMSIVVQVGKGKRCLKHSIGVNNLNFNFRLIERNN